MKMLVLAMACLISANAVSQTAALAKAIDAVWGGGDEMGKWSLTLAADGRAFFSASFIPAYSTWVMEGTNTIVVDMGGLVPASGNLLMATNKVERFTYDPSADAITWMSPYGNELGRRTSDQSGSKCLDLMMVKIREGLKNRKPDWRDPVIGSEVRDFETIQDLIAIIKTNEAKVVSLAPQGENSGKVEFKLNFVRSREKYVAYASYVEAKYHFGEEKFRGLGVKLPKQDNIGIVGCFPVPYWTCDDGFRKEMDNLVPSDTKRIPVRDYSVCSVESHCWVKDVAKMRRIVLGEFEVNELQRVIEKLPSRIISFPCRCQVEATTFKSQ